MSDVERVAQLVRESDLLAEAIRKRNREILRLMRLNDRTARKQLVAEVAGK